MGEPAAIVRSAAAELYDAHVLRNYPRQPVTLVRGRGTRVWDDQGNSYLDFSSGIAVDSLGHCHPHWVAAVQRQAAEIVHDGGVFWGVQYHPEHEFAEVAAIIERRAASLAREGLVEDEDAAHAFARDLRGLDEHPRAAWRLGIGDSVLTREARALELANFLEARVRPFKSARGRA